MSRLPIVGGDYDAWGTVLNDFLGVAHNADGTLKNVFNPQDYGAVFDFVYGVGGTDNYQAIQDALDAAAAYTGSGSGNTGAVVQLPAGQGMLAHDSPSLVVTNGVWLRGYGPGATRLYRYGPTQLNTNNNPVFTMDTGNHMAKLSDFGLEDQTGTSLAAGILLLSGEQIFGGLGGTAAELQRLVLHVQGDGFDINGYENRVLDCYVRSALGHGFKISGTDMFIANCTADTCELTGFKCDTANSKFVNCKAFGSGYAGFAAEASFRSMFSSCESQDNNDSGFVVGPSNTLAACVADTNARNPTNLGDDSTQCGFAILGPATLAGCFAINREGTSQKYGYWAQTFNGLPATVAGCNSQLPGVEHVHSDSEGSIIVNALLGQQSVAYSTPLTPDPYNGGTIVVGTLTGDITINAPASGVFRGMRIGFQLTQDGSGGHGVTFDAVYKTTGSIATVASTVTKIEFQWDGTNFRELSRTVMAS